MKTEKPKRGSDEEMRARVEKLAPRLRAYVRGLQEKVADLTEQLGSGPHELDTTGLGGPPRRLPDGEFRMFNKDGKYLAIKLEKDRLGFRLYGSDTMVAAFDSTNRARVSVGDCISMLAYHGDCSHSYKNELRERFMRD